MKIVHICLCGPYNDNWGYQDNLIPKYNKKDGHDVTVITSIFINSTKHEGYERISPGEYYLEDGVKVIRIPFKSFFINNIVERLRIYNGLYENLEKEEPDIIFMHGIQFWDIRTVIEYKKKHPNVKIFADNHADHVNSAKNFLSKYILHKIIWKSGAKKLVPYCEKIFGVTPNRCDFLMEMYDIPQDKVELLVMGADSEKIDFPHKNEIRRKTRKELRLSEEDFVLITGGKIDRHKNIQHLMQAVNEFADQNLKLIVFGTPSEDMKDIISSLSSTPFVRNVGWIDADNVYNYFLASDLAVFPGTHSVLWEQAVGSGLPCIFKRWKGMTHVDIDGNCIFVENGDKEEIKETLKKVLNDKKEYEAMYRAAQSKGLTYFSYQNISRRAIGQTD